MIEESQMPLKWCFFRYQKELRKIIFTLIILKWTLGYTEWNIIIWNQFWKYVFTSRTRNISAIQNSNNMIHTLAKTFIFSLRNYEILSYLPKLLRISFKPIYICFRFFLPIVNISTVSFSSSLNMVRVLRAYHRIVRIDISQNLCFGFIEG